MRCAARLVSLVTAFAGSPALARADVVFADPDFANANWVLETLTSGTGGSASASQFTPGNPGSARRISVNANTGGAVIAFSRYGTTTATRYAPATDGAIASISFALDAQTTSREPGLPVWIALKQGQTIYGASAGTLGLGELWTAFSATGLNAASFARLDGAPGAPDFSVGGSPIRFGFAVGTPASASFGEKMAIFDNFSVSVTPVPAPSAVVFVVLLAGVARRRPRNCVEVS